MYNPSLPDKHPLMQRLHRDHLADPPTDARLLTLTLPLPSCGIHGLPALDCDWFYWACPQARQYLLGLGQAYRAQVTGSGRLEALSQAFAALQNSWHHRDLDDTGLSPVAFTGFAFDERDPMTQGWEGLPNAMLVVPELLLQQRGDQACISLSCALPQADPAPVLARWEKLLQTLFTALAMAPCNTLATLAAQIEQHPPLHAWPDLVARALAAIAANQLEKVVLARSLRVHTTPQIDPTELMAVLNQLYPDCRHFAIRAADLVFAAATPERLLTRTGARMCADALAGSSPVGSDAATDQQLRDALRHSPKNRHEHQLVVRGMQAALAPLCHEVSYAEQPDILRLRHVQHLWTEIRATPKAGVNLFDLAARLHPTAAVSGTPSKAAQDWIETHEGLARGWYTGGGGFIHANGDGEIAVLLRCARLRGQEAALYAGAGIVAGSDAQAERHEIDVKLKAILEALGLV